jgi:hypothetical protein
MALQNEAPAFAAAIIGRDDLPGASQIDAVHRRGLRMLHQVDVGEAEPIDLISPLAEARGHPVLQRRFLPAQTAELHHPGEKGHLVVEIAIDGRAEFGRDLVGLRQNVGFQDIGLLFGKQR